MEAFPLLYPSHEVGEESIHDPSIDVSSMNTSKGAKVRCVLGLFLATGSSNELGGHLDTGSRPHSPESRLRI